MKPDFDTILIADWSARSVPSAVRPCADAIWIGVARAGSGVAVEEPVYLRTRAAAFDWIAAFLADEIAAERRVLAGFDFPFGYPAGVAERLTGQASALALWNWLDDAVEDGPDNTNNRFAVAGRINRSWSGLGPMWGRPASADHPDIPVTATERHGAHPPERRLADRRAKGAKTVWQLAYAGSVGSQMLLGIPVLQRLRTDPRLARHVAVWPFETGLSAPASRDRPVWLTEVYPSLIRDRVAAERREGEILDAAQVRVNAGAFARLAAENRLACLLAGAPDLTDAERRTAETEEAWILGLGHEASLAQPAPLKAAACASRSPAVTAPAPLRYERDPQAIYRQSFATVRAETRLSHLPDDLHDTAIRLVHACGMPEIADRLAWSADVAASARTALNAGKPILCDCRMVASGIIRARLPAENPVLCTLNDEAVPGLAAQIGNTRSAAAVELWPDHLDGAVVAIGNAPTALFHLLELLDQGAPKPAAILGFPVGFVGAAESKAELAADPRGVPFLTLRGRRGGSAMAAAAVNALAAHP